MLSAYSVLKVLHVLAVITWVGGTAMTLLLAMRLLRTGERARLFRFVGDVEWVGKFVYAPASIAVFVFGVATAIVGHYNFFTPWLVLGIIGIALAVLISVLFFEPEFARILRIGEGDGPEL